jgi:hypothetical protein
VTLMCSPANIAARRRAKDDWPSRAIRSASAARSIRCLLKSRWTSCDSARRSAARAGSPAKRSRRCVRPRRWACATRRRCAGSASSGGVAAMAGRRIGA